ncbi:methyltransferase domain-containing protein [Dactylosporangium sp. NPDC049742]|uniref:methyltransferase domain-containing protein n=1 Tax=Dactylosporangium sp. NPDC049742 TaxID=3154737 RepID=UPI0034321876
MTNGYTKVFQNADAVDKYEHATYAPGTYASHVGDRQRAYLRALVRRTFRTWRPTQHDFACGTGRAIRALHGLVHEAHGYDTSADMMAKAAELGVNAAFHQVAADGPVPSPVPTPGPAVVTMFRLMLNVDDDVRHRALSFAAEALPTAEAGLLVVENHGNARSVRHLRARRQADNPWFAELSHRQMYGLLRSHGFEVVQRRGFAMLSKGWYERPGLNRAAHAFDAVAGKLPGADEFAVNVVYVGRRG